MENLLERDIQLYVHFSESLLFFLFIENIIIKYLTWWLSGVVFISRPLTQIAIIILQAHVYSVPPAYRDLKMSRFYRNVRLSYVNLL